MTADEIGGAKFVELAGAPAKGTAGTAFEATVGATSNAHAGVTPEAFPRSLAFAREETTSSIDGGSALSEQTRVEAVPMDRTDSPDVDEDAGNTWIHDDDFGVNTIDDDDARVETIGGGNNADDDALVS